MTTKGNEKPHTWGGKREGAGRKTKGEDARTSIISVCATKATLDRFRQLREFMKSDKVSFNKLFEAWVKDMADDYGIE